MSTLPSFSFRLRRSYGGQDKTAPQAASGESATAVRTNRTRCPVRGFTISFPASAIPAFLPDR